MDPKSGRMGRAASSQGPPSFKIMETQIKKILILPTKSLSNQFKREQITNTAHFWLWSKVTETAPDQTSSTQEGLLRQQHKNVKEQPGSEGQAALGTEPGGEVSSQSWFISLFQETKHILMLHIFNAFVSQTTPCLEFHWSQAQSLSGGGN